MSDKGQLLKTVALYFIDSSSCVSFRYFQRLSSKDLMLGL